MSSSSSFEHDSSQEGPRLRVAVIGGGVAGLAAAWHLHTQTMGRYDVHVFEAESSLGGHAHTTQVPLSSSSSTSSLSTTSNQSVNVDLGFMVFNHENYPNLMAWFERLGIAEEDTDMSLSISLQQPSSPTFRNDSNPTTTTTPTKIRVEWCSSGGLSGLLANPWQALSWQFWRFVYDLWRFHQTTPHVQFLSLSDDDPRKHVTMGQYLHQQGYSPAFATHYLVPMMAALWSASSLHDVLDFPAVQLLSFLANHQMLQLFNRPKWKTVAGRSQQYTQKVQNILGPNQVHLSCPIHAVQRQSSASASSTRNPHGYSYTLYGRPSPSSSKDGDSLSTMSNNNDLGTFDYVIFACHPPTAAAMLQGGQVPEPSLLHWLSQIAYSDNAIYLHSDVQLMPRSRRAWASWNCLAPQYSALVAAATQPPSKQQSIFGPRRVWQSPSTSTTTKRNDETNHESSSSSSSVYVTYWLNQLQNLTTTTVPILVSLNPPHPPAPSLLYQTLVWQHPQFTLATVQAREQVQRYQYNHKNKNNKDNNNATQQEKGLYFAGAWAGYGFHEDGCRSGLQVATHLSQTPVPWVVQNPSDAPTMVADPPDFVSTLVAHANRPIPNGSWWWWSRWLSWCTWPGAGMSTMSNMILRDLPIALSKRMLTRYWQSKMATNSSGGGSSCLLQCRLPNGTVESLGSPTNSSQPSAAGSAAAITLRIFDEWFFVQTAWGGEWGLAKSYLAGYFNVEQPPPPPPPPPPLLQEKEGKKAQKTTTAIPTQNNDNNDDNNETCIALGDPTGLLRLFMLFIPQYCSSGSNGDMVRHIPRKAAAAAGWSFGWSFPSFSFPGWLSWLWHPGDGAPGHWYCQDLIRRIVDPETLTCSSGIFSETVPAATSAQQPTGLVLQGSLEEAQWRKIDTYLARAQLQPDQTLLDLTCGWGSFVLRAATKYGCQVTGVVPSLEQQAFVQQRAKEAGVQHLVTCHVSVDYRAYCCRPENRGKFDRVISCEMMLNGAQQQQPTSWADFFWSVEQVLNPHDGILVMGAVTTPENLFSRFRSSMNFVTQVLFPGATSSTLGALLQAAYQNSCLTLEHVDNLGLHYAATCEHWRRRLNKNGTDQERRALGLDDVTLRALNYGLTYSQASFSSQTQQLKLLVFSRSDLGTSGLATGTTTSTDAELQALAIGST